MVTPVVVVVTTARGGGGLTGPRRILWGNLQKKRRKKGIRKGKGGEKNGPVSQIILLLFLSDPREKQRQTDRQTEEREPIRSDLKQERNKEKKRTGKENQYIQENRIVLRKTSCGITTKRRKGREGVCFSFFLCVCSHMIDFLSISVPCAIPCYTIQKSMSCQ
jgi:hypothetical protein